MPNGVYSALKIIAVRIKGNETPILENKGMKLTNLRVSNCIKRYRYKTRNMVTIVLMAS